MPTWVVVMLAVITGVLAVILILILFFCLRSKDKKQPPTPPESSRKIPARTESTIGVRPKIPNPIYTINTQVPEKGSSGIADTLTTRKLSMMFDSKKRFSTAFSRKSAYFDFENSPLPRHKEYLDFGDIENMIPAKKQVPSPDRPSLDFLNEIHEVYSKAKPNSSGSPHSSSASSSSSKETIIDDNLSNVINGRSVVKQVFAEDEISYNQNRGIYAN